jgi:hypothetical protein
MMLLIFTAIEWVFMRVICIYACNCSFNYVVFNITTKLGTAISIELAL